MRILKSEKIIKIPLILILAFCIAFIAENYAKVCMPVQRSDFVWDSPSKVCYYDFIFWMPLGSISFNFFTNSFPNGFVVWNNNFSVNIIDMLTDFPFLLIFYFYWLFLAYCIVSMLFILTKKISQIINYYFSKYHPKHYTPLPTSLLTSGVRNPVKTL